MTGARKRDELRGFLPSPATKSLEFLGLLFRLKAQSGEWVVGKSARSPFGNGALGAH